MSLRAVIRTVLIVVSIASLLGFATGVAPLAGMPVEQFVANGLNVQLAPTANVLQPGDFSDERHPNDAGHLLLAQAFAASL